MEITKVDIIRKYDDDTKMKALAAVTIDNCFIIKDIRVINGEKGLFVAMPSRKMNEGGYRDVAHPLNKETRTMFDQAVLEAYKQAE